MKRVGLIAIASLIALTGCEAVNKAAEPSRRSLACGAINYSSTGNGPIPDKVYELCHELVVRDGEVAKANIEATKQRLNQTKP